MVSPALVMGDEGRPLKEVLSRSLTNGYVPLLVARAGNGSDRR